ncbi:enolase C-terminal domain-like protein [Piscinibacter sakaiensis]|uniref:mandelate racemase/muconate lactonizing enzyme family protein n=1 Tax=Piscinibacter sakaiensis TaxID=1547922 RepID=UPI00372910D8
MTARSEPAPPGPAIAAVTLHRLRLPLHRPYRLAFGDLPAFDTLLVELRDAEGRSGFGEATFLPGYGEESLDEAWPLACLVADAAIGRSASALVDAVARRDMLAGHPALAGHAEGLRVPLLALLNADDPARAADEFEALLAQGFRTVKVKVGLAGGGDLARLRWIQRLVDGRALIRIDANQAFAPDAAAALLAALDPQGIELFEQPCAAADWAGHARAAAASRVPLMLDESIYGLDDIDRAARERLAAWLKVKLVKFAGLDALGTAMDRIRSHGLRAVLGNGVAADVGCWMEACVAAGRLDNAGEMNGWLKLRRPLLADPPRLEGGALVLPPGWRPALDPDAVQQQALQRHEAPRRRGPAH